MRVLASSVAIELMELTLLGMVAPTDAVQFSPLRESNQMLKRTFPWTESKYTDEKATVLESSTATPVFNCWGVQPAAESEVALQTPLA